MQYRINQRTGDKISVLGFGTSSIPLAREEDFEKTLKLAFEGGINYYDLATSDASTFPVFGKVFEKVRDKVFYQVHFGADYTKGAYGWTLDPKRIKESIAWQLKNLRTDYIDYGFIHCMDEESDFRKYVSSGAFDYLLKMKEEGVVKHIGLSSHNPKTANLILDTGKVDMLMFSINPAYDYERGDEWGQGSIHERNDLYMRCVKEGVGISVMKPFGGGQLLDEKASPFKKALTHYQCIQYALDKPGILTVLPGVRGSKDIEKVLGFLTASDEEKDYSILSSFTPEAIKGSCVYCHHCAPCPIGIDVAMVNKYYDLALLGDELAKDHYRKLEHHAKDCIRCMHCNSRCPFHVNQVERMKEIAEYFGY